MWPWPLLDCSASCSLYWLSGADRTLLLPLLPSTGELCSCNIISEPDVSPLSVPEEHMITDMEWFAPISLLVWTGRRVPLLLLGSMAEEIQSSVLASLELRSHTVCVLLCGLHTTQVRIKRITMSHQLSKRNILELHLLCSICLSHGSFLFVVIWLLSNKYWR